MCIFYILLIRLLTYFSQLAIYVDQKLVNKSTRATTKGGSNNINIEQPPEEHPLEETLAGIAIDHFSAEEQNIGDVEDAIVEEDRRVVVEDEFISGEEGIESDEASSGPNVDKIPDEDDSEVDEELKVIGGEEGVKSDEASSRSDVDKISDEADSEVDKELSII